MSKSHTDVTPIKSHGSGSVRSSLTRKPPSSSSSYQSNLRGTPTSRQGGATPSINSPGKNLENQRHIEHDSKDHKDCNDWSSRNSFGSNHPLKTVEAKVAASTRAPCARGSRTILSPTPSHLLTERLESVIHEDHSSFDGSLDSKDSDRDFIDGSATFPSYYLEDERKNILSYEKSRDQVQSTEFISSGFGSDFHLGSTSLQNSSITNNHYDQKSEKYSVNNTGTSTFQGIFESSWSSVSQSELSNNWDSISELDNNGSSGNTREARGHLRHERSSSFAGSDMVSEGTHSGAPLISQAKAHSRIPSVNSIYSANSNRPLSLGALKRTFSLRPGEGVSSNYVETIRKYAGTSYNEAGPGIWKLPAGIMPIDKRDMMSQSNRKFNRGASGLGFRASKSSGVELKHGHLQPRLLAAEVDEGDITNKFGALGRSNTLQNKSLTPVTSKSSTPSTGLNGVSRTSSLERVSTLASVSTAGDLQSTSSRISVSRRGSSTSLAESVGSVHQIHNMNIYYQHQGYKMETDDNNLTEDTFDYESGFYTNQSVKDEDDGPRLFLVNPDSN